jgi:hypothetical protein
MGVGLDASVFQYVREDKLLESEMEDIIRYFGLVLSFQVVYV